MRIIRPLSWTAPRRSYSSAANLILIRDATFYKNHPGSIAGTSSILNAPLYPKLNFELPATPIQHVGSPTKTNPHWAVIGTSPTSFLNVLRGEYISVPAKARTYPYLSSDEIAKKDPRLRIPSRAVQYVGFSTGSSTGATGVRGAYLSARYESRREETDWSVSQYLRGDTELNPSEQLSERVTDEALLSQVVRDLRMDKLLNMPVSNLSNGQTRRSRIAKALLSKPELLLLDEPFMGLDPPTLVTLSPILRDLAYRSSPLLLLGLRPQDPVPDWITHLVVLGDHDTIAAMGPKMQTLYSLYSWFKAESGWSGTSEASKRAARALRQAHGSRLTGLGDLLTSNGVRKLDTVLEEVWTQMQESDNLGKEGLVAPEGLDKDKQHIWEQAHKTSEDARTAQDWLNLTSLLPEKLERHLLQTQSDAKAAKATMSFTEPGNSGSSPTKSSVASSEPPLIELSSIIVKYGSKVVLGHGGPQPGFNEPGLNLSIRKGTRLLLLGVNGSGKTTLLSLLTSDHPQSYSLPIRFFGRTRLPSPGKAGLSLWEIQSRIGHSSPEVHAFFPKSLTVRQVLESAWAETFSSKPVLTPERSALVDHFLRVWKTELCQYDSTRSNIDSLDWAADKVNHPAFGRLHFGTQRLLLLLRAIIKQPDIIILDEAFSGLPTAVRDKALGWLEKGDASLASASTTSDHTSGRVGFPGLTDQQALIVVSHVREEVPDCIVEFVRLPSEEEATEQGRVVELGRSPHGEIKSAEGWNRVWGL